ERCPPEVHELELRIAHRCIEPIEFLHVLNDARIVRIAVTEREVGDTRRLARRISDDDRNMELAKRLQQSKEFVAAHGPAATAGVRRQSVDARKEIGRVSRLAGQLIDDALRVPDERAEERRQPNRDHDDRRAADHYSIRSAPKYGRNAAGSSTEPSACWCCSRI